ncbi:hypothetical protein [Corallococcus carmarthensis]|uniref:Lipoprotein n=1 Tax=Corallococcus carmarthensis TaxID=2316728 RepID=A0A3A8KK16_9BACT|nr:hypothetical protein [Corallococcus carmarthensis]NOK15450.1 hypothetical protein [Corallococcus carmarthensis]RKH07727.1 hypothetical protein D7X32_01280 [Corallococcus carmarthensis]
MRASIVGGLAAMALMAVGCGAPVEQEEGPDLASQEATIPDCSGSPDSLIMYFKDASYSEQIGGRGCHCGWWESWGRTSTFQQYINEC